VQTLRRRGRLRVVELDAPRDDLDEIPDGTPLAEVPARYGVTIPTVRRWVEARRWPRRHVDVEKIARCYQAGDSITEIARDLGIARSAVYDAMVREGISRRPRGTGSWNHRRQY
jgi:transposase